MKRKGLAIAGLVAGLSALTSMTAFAGEWKQDSNGWWWQNDDGSYPVSTWQWLDGNKDGLSESYYFNEAGYLVTNTTIDGYTVNADGAWIVDEVVQTKTTEVQVPQTEGSFGFDSQGEKYLAGELPPSPNWDESNAERAKPTSTVYQYREYWNYIMGLSDEELARITEAAKTMENKKFLNDLEKEASCRSIEQRFGGGVSVVRGGGMVAPEDRTTGLK